MSMPCPCQRFPIRSLVATSILVVAGIAVACRDRSVDFNPYFAGLPPLVAAAIVCLAGIVALHLLQENFGFCVKSSRINWRGWLTAIGLAVPFMTTVTLADLALKFPPDINVRLPTSLVFYPTMAFVAQISLHIVPLVLLLWTLTRLLATWTEDRRIWLSIILAALPEAAFLIGGSDAQAGNLTLSAFVGAQLFVFGLAELYLFRRFDFACMYVFRLTYYGYWHILWGNLRI